MNTIAIMDYENGTIVLDNIPIEWDSVKVEEWLQESGWKLSQIEWLMSETISIIDNRGD